MLIHSGVAAGIFPTSWYKKADPKSIIFTS